jgi:hypothetical protein
VLRTACRLASFNSFLLPLPLYIPTPRFTHLQLLLIHLHPAAGSSMSTEQVSSLGMQVDMPQRAALAQGAACCNQSYNTALQQWYSQACVCVSAVQAPCRPPPHSLVGEQEVHQLQHCFHVVRRLQGVHRGHTGRISDAEQVITHNVL